MGSHTLLGRLIAIVTITTAVGSTLQIASYTGRRAWQFIRFLGRAPFWVGYILVGLCEALALGPAAYVLVVGPPQPDSAGGLYFTFDTYLMLPATVAWVAYMLPYTTWWPRTARARRGR
jgi:hypothetical protein